MQERYTEGGIYGMIMSARYDWCFDDGQEKRNPDEYRYSFDPYYLWRDFNKERMDGIDSVYSDRMREWDPKKYEAACKKSKFRGIDSCTKTQAKAFIEAYYDDKYECVGVGRACNVSNGYPLGLFFLKEKKAKKKRAS
ncbi:hypothetical protein [Sulfitobacter sp. R18_1]|uniref:hypothetical protein n=1 Tax=Sulfitobacter sp. R18_1 TaxID=2821104 RepID=UPI001ADD3B58|nr:hypothetical protein [Sulfitobacter sp. R18_1]MBO9428818.1 hypothetical protein [Sulfitobacter sp. R18_1]